MTIHADGNLFTNHLGFLLHLLFTCGFFSCISQPLSCSKLGLHENSLHRILPRESSAVDQHLAIELVNLIDRASTAPDLVRHMRLSLQELFPTHTPFLYALVSEGGDIFENHCLAPKRHLPTITSICQHLERCGPIDHSIPQYQPGCMSKAPWLTMHVPCQLHTRLLLGKLPQGVGQSDCTVLSACPLDSC